MLKER